VDAALRIVEERGFSGLTMRALATELGLSPMAVYHHVRSKDELVRLAADSVLRQVEMPGPEHGDWAAQILLLNQRYRAAHLRYPGMTPRQLRTGLTDNGRIIVGQVLQLLLDAGFDEHETAYAFATLNSYFYGRVWTNEFALVGLSDFEDDDVDGGLLAFVAHAHASESAIGAFTAYLTEASKNECDNWGLEILLDGLRARLSKPGRS
jgi:AcrR family transcriptional regulator